jgi:plasmid replication initiation protein
MNMSDFDIKNKVVQANDLVQLSKWNLDAVPLKILKTLVSCIDTKNPPKDNTVCISKQELAQAVGSEKHKDYDHIKKQTKSLQRQIIELKQQNGGILSLSVMPSVYWPPKDSDELIECTFAKELMPFLIGLKECFLQYDVGSLKNFKSKYGLILYEYLLSRERQERQSEHKYSISIEDLRRLTDTEKKLKNFKELNRKVIKQSVDDINTSGVEFLVCAKNNGKRGIKATHVEFELRKRTSYKETEFDVVEHPEWIHQLI